MPQVYSGQPVDSQGYIYQDIGAVANVVLGATAVVNFGSSPAAVVVPAVNASIFSGVTSVTNTAGALDVNLKTSSITVAVNGSLTNNNAAPAATLIGVLPAIAETAYNTVTYTTGDMVLPVTDLHGALNQDLQASAGVQLGSTAVTAFGTAPAAANVIGANVSLFAGVTGITATGSSLNVNITGGATGSTQYNNGSTPTPPIVGTAVEGVDAAGVVHVLNTDASGNQVTMPAVPTLQLTSQSVINTAGTGNNYVIAGLAGKTIRIMALLLQVSGITGGTPTTLTLKDGTTALTGPFAFLNGAVLNLENTGAPWYICSTGVALGFNINQSGTAQLSGTVWYTQS